MKILTAFLCCMIFAGISNAQQSYIPGLHHPEDLAAIPGTHWLVISCMGEAGNAGRLMMLNTADNNTKPVTLIDSTAGNVPKRFSPHGICIRKNGKENILYVVNHGGGESVEVFNLRMTAKGPQAIWKERIPVPVNSATNAVAALPNGDLLVTKMYDPTENFVQNALTGAPTGEILRWTRGQGWKQASSHRLSCPNGLEVSPDGLNAFVSEWATGKLWKLPLDRQDTATIIDVKFLPDNLKWTSRGTLLLTGQNTSVQEIFTCLGKEETCKKNFTVMEIHPETLEATTILESGNARFGAASTTVELSNGWWVGSFLGDHIARYDRK